MTDSLPMGTADLATLRAMDGRPLPTGILLRFGGAPPTLEQLRDRVAQRAGAVPALQYRIARRHGALRRVGRLDVEWHVREAVLPDDTDGTRTGRLMLSEPLPAGSRAPWDVWLIRGAGDGYTLCYRNDHTMQDGTGAAHAARALLDDVPRGGPALHRPSWPSPAGLAGALADVVTFRGSGPWPGFRALPGPATRMCHAETPLDRLRGVGHAFGGTVNDVYLGALAHAVRTWHLKATGELHPAAPVAVPMTVRAPGEEYTPGNRMVLAHILLPCDEETPAGALRRVIAQTGRMRRTGQRDALRLLKAATPRRLGARLGARMVRREAIIAPAAGVDFGGPLTHRGDPALDAAMFTEAASGVLCYTSLTGYHDTARLTVVHNEALPTADQLPDLWLGSLIELDRAG